MAGTQKTIYVYDDFSPNVMNKTYIAGSCFLITRSNCPLFSQKP